MTDDKLLRSARQETREQVWHALSDELEKDRRVLRPLSSRFSTVYLPFIGAVSVGITIGILSMAMIYFIIVFLFHLELP